MKNGSSKRGPIESRVEDLLGQMTLLEKVGQINQRLHGWRAYQRNGSSFELTVEFKDEVKRFGGMGALYGLFRADPWSGVTWDTGIAPEHSARVANKVQKYVVENTRLGIPVLLSEEVSHGHLALGGTLVPTNIGIGSSWNPELYEKTIMMVGREVRSRGGHLGLVPCLDILRDPRWGRSEECFGEDPCLASHFTSAATRGLQRSRMTAVLKHFCAQGAGEGGRNLSAVSIGERELREIHLPAMQAGVAAGAQACMAAYNEIDGIPCHANRKLLTEILREEWGFKGVVMADGGAVDRLLLSAGDNSVAAAVAVNAGVDMSLWDDPFHEMVSAVEEGKVKEADIDQSVRRILQIKFELGLFENPYVDETSAVEIVGAEELQQANLQLARESLVLLKNEADVLPLRQAGRIAVVGPNADSLYNQLGDYTAPQKDEGITVLQGIREFSGAAVQVDYARGCGIREPSKEGFPEALSVAEASDIIIAVMGGCSTRDFNTKGDEHGAAIVSEYPSEMDCGEGMDVADLSLGGVQSELVEELIKTGKPVVLVLIQGRPYTISNLIEHVPAVLCAWYPGHKGGYAIAEALFGKFNPCGKLPVAYPRSTGALPVCYNHKDIGREILYCDISSAHLFPFGFGLSYTVFEYSRLRIESPTISSAQLKSGGAVHISVDVFNAGDRFGHETVQLYIRDIESSITRRIRELKGFKKIGLQPGELQTVDFELGESELGIWNAEMKFVIEPGLVQVMAGRNSEDLLSSNLEISDI